MDMFRHGLLARAVLVVALLLAPMTGTAAAPADCGMAAADHGLAGGGTVLVDHADCCEPDCSAVCAAHATLVTPVALALAQIRLRHPPLQQPVPRAGHPSRLLRPPLLL